MAGVLFEGGSFRPIFSCGVMDALLEEDIMFPYCIGVSAGAADAASYISGQRRRNLEIMEKYRNDKRYLAKRNLLKERSPFGIEFVFRTIPNEKIPFDFETFQNYSGQFVITVTDAETGNVHYFGKEDVDREYKAFQATCSLPVIFPPVEIGERKYYDGGLSNPIPIDKLVKDGQKKALIVLTRPEGYVKECTRMDRMVAKAVGLKYPRIAKRVLTRYQRYNQAVKACERLEREGRAVLLRPAHPLESFEGNVDTLRKNYQEGYQMAMEQMDRIRGLL
ncbi:MAG: patatin family protein [Lachnospiraceae bacterium]|nr:patatin family protein [Lachnospiraceae bacterium]